MQETLRSGMVHLDTAPLYVLGTAEEGVGRALAGVARDRYRVSTKTGYVMTGPASVAELRDTVALARLPIPAALWADLKAAGLIPPDAPTPAGGTFRAEE